MSDLGNKEIFSANLKYYMNQYNKTRQDICNELNFKYTTFSDWYNGKKYPRIDKIEMLASYFHIQKSDLIERHSDEKDLPELTAKDEREIESDLEDMMHSVASASCEGDDDFEDIEAFKAAVKVAMVQAKRIAKKKYTPKKYRK